MVESMSMQLQTQVKPNSTPMPSFTPVQIGLQRKCASNECERRKKKLTLQRSSTNQAESSEVPPIVHEVLRSPGQPLDPATRAFMEPRFGYDFSKVRVHTDAKAAESALAMDALAYTVGRDIVFGQGQYQSNVSAGRKLIAHELVHTIQQRGFSSNHTVSSVSEKGDFSEVEAGGVAHAALVEKVPVISQARLILARQGDPDFKKQLEELRNVPGPSLRLSDEPEEEKFEEAISRPRGRLKIAAPSTWGWGSPETNNVYQECTVAPMMRERFLKFEATLPKQPPKPQRRKPTDGPEFPLGATWPDLAAAVAPEIAAEPVKEDGKTLFRLKPTHAEMPPIKSAYTQAETFQEGNHKFMAFEANGQRVCPNLGGVVPLFWQITEDGANKIWAGEMEHCSDIRAAFDVTLSLYASAINNEAAAERRYTTEKDVINGTKKRLPSIPLDPVNMLNAYGQEIEKTRLRDTLRWHEGVTSDSRKPQENNCKGYLGIFSEKSFPEVGDGPGKEKHSSQEVLQGTAGKIKGKP
jgi:hypothetical protein